MSRCLGDEPVVRRSWSQPLAALEHDPWLGRSMAVTAQLRRRSTLLSAYHCWSVDEQSVEIGGPLQIRLDPGPLVGEFGLPPIRVMAPE